MKKASLSIAIILAVFSTQQSNAGDPVKLDPFHSIYVSSEVLVELILSDEEQLVINFENAPEENLIVEVVDSVLRLRMKTGRYKDAKLNVQVHYNKDLRMMEANGRAQIWSEEHLFFDKDLYVRLFNGGEMRFDLHCDSLHANLSQGAIIQLRGEARALKVKTTTNATFSGYEFNTEYAEVLSTGTGKAKVSVSKYLNANAQTKGFIGYVGEPEKVDEKTSVGGEILKTFLE